MINFPFPVKLTAICEVIKKEDKEKYLKEEKERLAEEQKLRLNNKT
jgi:hypothetical protein